MIATRGYSMKKIIITVIIVAVLILISIIFFILNSTAIYKGVTINGVSVGGLNTIEASKYLEDRFEENLINKIMKLRYKEYVLEIKYGEIGVTYDYYSASKKAYKVGRQGNIDERVKSIFLSKFYGKDINMELIYDNHKISSIMNRVKNNINVESKDAEIKFVNNRPVITSEIVGKKIQEDLLKQRIIDSLLHKDIVEIPVIEDIPRLTHEILSKITTKIGTFSTSFSGSTEGRIHNIELAAESIDGKLILPNEVFSFNETTGDRNTEAGYKESIVIVDGDYTSGVGGGVCQVSSTLYNALLLADMEIIERHPHSIPASYVHSGRDAAVAYNYLDLKFRNILDVPVYLKAKINGTTLFIDIFSKKNDSGRVIKIESDIVEKIEPEIEESVDELMNSGEKTVVQKGRYGYKVKTYKIVLFNGKEESRELITNDYYKPKKYIIKKGPDEENDIKEEVDNGGAI